MVPLKPIGRMVLNRNPDNFFAETEQVAFHPGHVVPGIDFSTIRYCRDASSRTSIRSSVVWAAQTFTRFR